jgi:hypothetical protein
LENSLRLAPQFLRAQKILARVYRQLGQPEQAALCEAKSFATLRDVREKQKARQALIREEAAARASVRAEQDKIRQGEIDRKKAEYDAIEPKELLIVSGLPRSGTSLMMQMLRAGGIEPMTDAKRAADEDNPEGYWEWEAIKKLPQDPRLIEQAEGKSVRSSRPSCQACPASTATRSSTWSVLPSRWSIPNGRCSLVNALSPRVRSSI